MADLFDILEKEPGTGSPLGNNYYKIRIAIASKSRGKSGGARVITNFVIADDSVYLLSIYDKAEQDTLRTKELARLLNLVPD